MTNKITLDREREAFEAWYASEFLHGDEKTNPDWFSTSLCGTYRYAQVREGWTTWSARAALAENPQADVQPVAWLVESPADLEPINGVAYTKEQADMYRAGRWTVLPVYTHPAPAKVEPVPPAGE